MGCLRVLTLIGLAGATGCSIVQDVQRIDALPSNAICVIEDPAVRAGVSRAIRYELQNLGCTETTLPQSAGRAACPVSLTYTARWSWDLTTYMSFAHLRAFNESGHQIGEAVYDARRGGGRMDKFIAGEDKIRELVRELFAGQCR